MEAGWGLYGLLWSETLLFHARKHYVGHEMMRKYSDNPLVPRTPSLIPGFLHLLPALAAALEAHAKRGQGPFPQWKPPDAWGDWAARR